MVMRPSPLHAWVSPFAVAYVPGAAFYSGTPDHNTLRLSFVTASVEQIHTGIAALAGVIVRLNCSVTQFAVVPVYVPLAV